MINRSTRSGRYLPRCSCSQCRREKMTRLLSGAGYWLNLYRGELDRVQGRSAHVSSIQYPHGLDSQARSDRAMWGE